MSAAHVDWQVGQPRILLVEDDEQLRMALTRFLAGSYHVTAVPSAELAVDQVRAEPFDAILCDVKLLGMDGLELLRRVRETDLDVPFLLMTGEPTVETAMRAVEHGATRYLRKPLDMTELRKGLASAVSMHTLGKARRSQETACDRNGRPASGARLDAVIEAALGSLRVAWQPIVCWPRRRVVGYEALMRSSMPSPDGLIEAAVRAGRGGEVTRAMRCAVARTGTLAPASDLYVNIHPPELLDEEIYDPHAPLTALASRIVLEVNERASLDAIPELRSRLGRLRKLGYRIALGDLGAGHAGLASFELLEPEVVKIDRMLVRDLHRSTTRRRLIASLLAACRDLSCTPVAQGVELPAEREALTDLGCELFQGFLFARPAFAFPEPTW